MYKVTSRIVLALRSPSGFSLEIRGWGNNNGKWGMGRGKWGLPLTLEMARAWKKSPQCPSYSLPLGGRAGVGNSVQGTSKAIAF